jgi:hypothetical protein
VQLRGRGGHGEGQKRKATLAYITQPVLDGVCQVGTGWETLTEGPLVAGRGA